MNLYLVLRSTHISTMLLTILLTMAAEPLYLLAARGRSTIEVQRRYRLAERVRQVSQLTMLGGLLTGLGMVVLAGWNPFAPWLLATYGLLVLMSVIGRAATAWQGQVRSLLAASGGAAVADTQALLVDRRALVARLAIIAIFWTIRILMNQKPTFGL
jgi:uncharacterized membrane protein